MPTNQHMYSVADLAERWQVSRVYVYKMLESRELPGIKIGKLWRIHPLTVEEYENTHIQ